jgi:hypothetical protein
MGHLRTGGIPKTRKWQDVVSSIKSSSGIGEIPYGEIAEKTLDASNAFFRKLPYDEFFQCCFQFLVTLSIAGRDKDFNKSAKNLGIFIKGKATKINLSKALRDWIEFKQPKTYNSEIAILARKATADTIASWISENTDYGQSKLFEVEEDPYMPWRVASRGKGFCGLARNFFSNFTFRYLNYFLSRTANANLKTYDERRRFNDAISKNSEKVAQHAFETTKLVQSYSAGWFNKYSKKDSPPSFNEIKGFLIYSLEKLREEFRIQKEGQ